MVHIYSVLLWHQARVQELITGLGESTVEVAAMQTELEGLRNELETSQVTTATFEGLFNPPPPLPPWQQLDKHPPNPIPPPLHTHTQTPHTQAASSSLTSEKEQLTRSIESLKVCAILCANLCSGCMLAAEMCFYAHFSARGLTCATTIHAPLDCGMLLCHC